VRLPLSVFAGLALACTSAAPPPAVWEREPDYYVQHDILGHIHKADARRFTSIPSHPEGGVELRTNPAGFRNDRSFSVPKPPNTWRALIVGDSHTDGVVDNADGLGDALARRLTIDETERGSSRIIEVVNGGTGYWGPQEYGAAFSVWSDLAPDLCIVVLYEGNDFLDAVAAEERAGTRALGRIEDHFDRLYAVTEHVGERVSQQLNQDLLFAHAPSAAQDAVLRTREGLVQAHDTCRDFGAPLLVLRLPPSGAVHPPTASEAEKMHELLGPIPWLSGRSLGQDLTRQLAATVPEVVVEDAWRPLFRAARGLRPTVATERPHDHTALRSDPAFMYWPLDHHLSLDGHRVIVEQLQRIIHREGWLAP
jgi:hypothetical protein